MTNSNDQWKVFKYYEGLCSSGDFPKEIAKVLSLGVKDKPHKDIDGNIIEPATVLRESNWDIVFPKPDAGFDLKVDDNGDVDATPEEYIAKINNQVNKISDTVILKTTTTKKNITDEEYDDLTVDPTQNAETLTMYLEIYKPAYIANPEEYPLDCERNGITPKLITRGLYEESYKSKKTYEDIFDNNFSSEITKSERKDTSFVDYAKHITAEDLDDYKKDLNAVLGEGAVQTPTGASPVTVTINMSQLNTIKQGYVNLYNFIRTTMGAEPEDYILLESVEVELSVEDESQELYQARIQGTLPITVYTINKDFSHNFTHIPTETPVLEMRLNGVYIPIDTEYYSVLDGNVGIKFDKTYTYESTREGLLVCRYSYEVTRNTVNEDGQQFITERESLLNNHYVLMRLFDHINFEGNGPEENTYNNVGEVIEMKSHVSDWAKLSWYKDFEEVMLDHLDEDVSISTIAQGSVVVPIETPGLNSDTKIRYWINTNNDRFSLIVMGNPSLDYQEDRHLVSACYCGAIDSFDNSINDTAGNFALFTSSSTEPCATKLNVEKSEAKAIPVDKNDPIFSNPAQFASYITAVEGQTEYFITLPEGEYFDRSAWPKYAAVDAALVSFTSDEKIDDVTFDSTTEGVALQSVHTKDYVMNGSNAYGLTFTLNAPVEAGKIIIVYAKTYNEKKVITSGITRDIFGNTINIQKTQTYGKNTSDGVTSIMMYHTRSKAFYQKHHMLFATTEEYMSKVMYGKSMYTGEYYADRIKVTHGNDGPRGILSDLLVIDSASLYALDELVINKDFEKDKYENEETFIYFPITAPFSPLSDSPNATYGLAIKKEEKEPAFTEETAMLKKALAQLETLYNNKWKKTGQDIFPIDAGDGVDANGNHVSIYWKVLENTAFKKLATGEEVPSTYVPLQLALVNTSEYKGDRTDELTNEGYNSANQLATVLTPGTTKSDRITSYVKIAGFAPSQLLDEEGIPVKDDEDNILYEDVYYGIGDEKIESLGNGATLIASINDGSQDANYPAETYLYSLTGVPYDGQLDASKIEADASDTPTEAVAILNAQPDKYLTLYSAKTLTDGTKKISKFACVPLKNASGPANALLQYPSEFTAYVASGGKIYKRGEGIAAATDSIGVDVPYNETFDIVCVPNAGYELSKVVTVSSTGAFGDEYALEGTNSIVVASLDSEDSNHGYEVSETDELAGGYIIIRIPAITDELHVAITFTKSES